MKKTLSLIIALAMLFSAMLGIMSTAEAEAPTGTLAISAASLEFASDVYLLIAVDYSALGLDAETAKESVTISVDGDILAVDESVMKTSGFPANCVGFKYTNLGAMRFGDILTIQAYLNGEANGDAVDYSVLEYTLRTRELYPSYTDLTDVCDNLLAFGAAAQKAFGHSGDYNLDTKYGMVFLHGTEGKEILPAGTTVTLPAPTDMVDPILYDSHLNRVANSEVTVPEGTIARYIYIPSESRTVLNFDATNETLTSEMFNATNNTSGTTAKKVYADIDGNLSSKSTAGTGEIILQVTKGATAAVSSVTLVEDENGKNQYVRFVCGLQQATPQLRIRPVANSAAASYNTLGDIFTITLTIGKEGKQNMIPISYRLRGDNSTDGRTHLIGFNNSGNESILCAPKNNGTELSSIITDGTNVAFTTIHIVVDTTKNTATYYTDTNTSTPVFVYQNAAINKDNVFNGPYALEIVLERVGTVLLKKIVYTKGNIFE